MILNCYIIFEYFGILKIDNKLNIGVSSSGKTQHFDCCIRRFESCHPSQKQQTQFCVCYFLFSFLAGFEPIVHLLRSKRDIKLLQATRLALSDSATPATSSQATYRLRRFFIASHSFRCSSSPKQITLKSPVRL